MNKKLSDSFFRDIKKQKLKANHGHLLAIYYISAGYLPDFVVQRYKLRPNKPNNLRTFLLKQHLHSKSHQILRKWKHVKNQQDSNFLYRPIHFKKNRSNQSV